MTPAKKGDLVWLPEDVMLVQFNHFGPEEDRAVSRWMHTPKPMNVLLVDIETDWPYYRVLCDGETWHVRNSDVYLLDEDCHVSEVN